MVAIWPWLLTRSRSCSGRCGWVVAIWPWPLTRSRSCRGRCGWVVAIWPWLLTRSRSCSGERGWVGRSSSALSITPAPPPPHIPTSGSVLRAARCSSETTQAMSSWGKPLYRPSAQRLFTQPLTSCALRAACCSEAVEADSELFACLPTDLAPVEGEREGRAHNQTLISHVFGLLAHSFPSLVPPSGLFPLMGPPLPPPKL